MMTDSEFLLKHKRPHPLSPESKEKMARLMKERQGKLAVLRRIAEIKKRQARIAAEQVYRKKHYAIKYYCIKPDGTSRGPNPVQDKFHRAKNKIRVMSGSNRLGKSTGGINEDVSHSLGYRPWLAADDPDYKVDVRVPNKGLICGESFNIQVATVLVPKLLGDPLKNMPGAIPTHELDHTKRNPQGIVTYIRFKNGSEMFLQSYDQEVDLFESADFDWAHFDEPPPRAIWVAVNRGLADRVGPCWLTMTPIKEAWVYDEIYSRKDVGLFYGMIEDNLGYGMTQAGIDQFALTLHEDEKEARLRGRFFHLVGLVYKSYGEIHKIPRNHLFAKGVPAHWAMWMHIDCHPRKAHHAVWVAISPDQRKYVVGELKNSDNANLIAPFCEAMRIYESTTLKYRASKIERLIDPMAGTPSPIKEGITMWDEFDEHGFTCKPGSKHLGAGVLLFQNELKSNPAEGRYPNIFFCDDLSGVDFEMRHYVWEEHANRKTAEKYDDKQTPRPKHDDFIQGIHRILLDQPFCDDGMDYAQEPAVGVAAGNPFTGY